MIPNELADINTDVMSYNPDFQYDIVSAFGSINFGDRAVIEPQVEKVVSFCKPGGTIFPCCNPGITHDDPDNKAYWIDLNGQKNLYMNLQISLVVQ